jgi:hypothetical protein
MRKKPKIEEYLMGVPLYYINSRRLPISQDLLWKQAMKARATLCLFKSYYVPMSMYGAES